MARLTKLLDGATSTGYGAVALPEGNTISVQAWIAAGSATVLIRGSNDERALATPSAAAWDTLATLTLSGADDQAALRDVVPFRYVTAQLTAVATGPVFVSLGY